MKKKVLAVTAIVAAVLGICSCNNQEMDREDKQRPSFEADGFGSVNFAVAENIILTKSTAESNNNKVNHLKFFIFDQSGSLIASADKSFSTPAAVTSSSASDTVKVTVPLGVSGMRVFAVANSKADEAQWATVTDTTTLKACISKLSSNTIDCMAAIGDLKDQTFAKEGVYTVNVKRFGAKVILDKVTTAFKSDAHKSLDFKLKAIYLTNVQPECPYSQVASNAAATSWYNQMTFTSVSTDVDALIAEKDLDVDMKTGISQKHYFYCYPNTINKEGDSHDKTSFTARRTRLVLETILGTNTYYYPIDLPGSDTGTLENNKTYTITDLKVTGIGTQDPEDKLEKGVIACNITIADWETGESWTVEY